MGIALGIGVLGSLQTAIYRANLQIPEGTPDPLAEAMNESLASAAGALGSSDAELLAVAQGAFTHGMQITAYIASLLLVIAAFIAWRLIPSTPISKEETRAEH